MNEKKSLLSKTEEYTTNGDSIVDGLGSSRKLLDSIVANFNKGKYPIDKINQLQDDLYTIHVMTIDQNITGRKLLLSLIDLVIEVHE